VEAIQEDTNVKATTETNGDGLYYFPSLHPTSYRIVVSRDGFKQVIQADIVLHVQDSITLNFALQLGSVSDTTDGTVTTTIDRKCAENLPLNGRGFQTLILLAPGTLSATGENGGNSDAKRGHSPLGTTHYSLHSRDDLGHAQDRRTSVSGR
jgi:hypothetical protein